MSCGVGKVMEGLENGLCLGKVTEGLGNEL